MTLLASAIIQQRLNNPVASWSSDRVNITHEQATKVLGSEYDFTQEAMVLLGVTLEDSKYTFTNAKSKNGERVLYGPSVALVDDKAAIVWGDAKIPLASLKGSVDIELTSIGNLTYMDLGNPEDPDWGPLTLRMALKKKEELAESGLDLEISTLRKLLKKGQLEQVLAPLGTGGNWKHLKDLAPTEGEPLSYSVVGYTSEPNKFNPGEIQYQLLVPVEGTTYSVKANKRLNDTLEMLLEANPGKTLFSPEKVGTLTVGIGKTSKDGKVSYPTTLFSPVSADEPYFEA